MVSTVITPDNLVEDETLFTVVTTTERTDITSEVAIFVEVTSAVSIPDALSTQTENTSITWWPTDDSSSVETIVAPGLNAVNLHTFPSTGGLTRGKSYSYYVTAVVDGFQRDSSINEILIKELDSAETDTAATVADNGAIPQFLFPADQAAEIYGSTKTFLWTPNNQAGITDWFLRVGTTGVSSDDIYSSSSQGSIPRHDPSTTSWVVTGLPANSSTVYVQLSYKVAGAWTDINTTFTSLATGTTAPPPLDTNFWEGTIAPPVISSVTKVNLSTLNLVDTYFPKPTDPTSGNLTSAGRFWPSGQNKVRKIVSSNNYTENLRIDCSDFGTCTTPIVAEGYRFVEFVGLLSKPEHIVPRLDPDYQLGNPFNQEYKSTYRWSNGYLNPHPRIALGAAIITKTTHGAALYGCDIDVDGAEADIHIGNIGGDLNDAANNFKIYHLYSCFRGMNGCIGSIHGDSFQNQTQGASGYGFYMEKCDTLTAYNGITVQKFGTEPWSELVINDCYIDWDTRHYDVIDRNQYLTDYQAARNLNGDTPVLGDTEIYADKKARPYTDASERVSGRFKERVSLTNIDYRAPRDTSKSYARVITGPNAGSKETQPTYVCGRYYIGTQTRVQQEKPASAGGGFIDAPLSEWSDNIYVIPGTINDKTDITSGTYQSIDGTGVAALRRAPAASIGQNFVFPPEFVTP